MIEYICVVFFGDKEKEQIIVVWLDDKGKFYYVIVILVKWFIVIGMNVNINDGLVIVIGNLLIDGGIIYKIWLEGDIVFVKILIFVNQGLVMFNQFQVVCNGNILVGGSGSKGYYVLLRNDGIVLYFGILNGGVRGVGMNWIMGELVVIIYDVNVCRGMFVCILLMGKVEFDCIIDGNFDKVKVINNGEVLLLFLDEGWVCMYFVMGEKEFDCYVMDNKFIVYCQVLIVLFGELFFLGSGSCFVKLGYGFYVLDVKIIKLVNGMVIVVFIVMLIGYVIIKEGVFVFVSVGYVICEVFVIIVNNFILVKGKLFFIFLCGMVDCYLVKQDIEVLVKVNDLIEGVKDFELLLLDVQQSYLVKFVGKVVIEDQQVVVKLVCIECGEEGFKDILYELGLFKIDGIFLINVMGVNIIVDGIYGEGIVDVFDFDMGLIFRVIFVNGL